MSVKYVPSLNAKLTFAGGFQVTKQWCSIQPQANGIPEVFTTYFGNYSAAILGVGGTLIS